MFAESSEALTQTSLRQDWCGHQRVRQLCTEQVRNVDQAIREAHPQTLGRS